MLRILLAAAFTAAVTAFGGCATYDRMNAPPAGNSRLAVQVSEELPSGMSELPVGVYQVPDTRIYIAGHQRGQGVGMAFGLIGVAIAHAANQERGKGLVGNAVLKSDIGIATQAALDAKIKELGVERAYMAPAGAPVDKGAYRLSVAPYLLLNYVSDTATRPYVILRASLRDAAGTEVWWSRYVSTVNDDRPISGDNSWSSDDARPLREAGTKALNAAVDVLVRDLAGKLPREAARDAKLKGRYAFLQSDLDLPGKLLGAEPYVIFVPKIGDVVVFAGVNIFPKELVQVSDAPPPAK